MASKDYYHIMQTFTEKNMPDLDTAVLGALELFTHEKLPKITIPYKKPLIIGSGNAQTTGEILFEERNAVFASESTYEKRLTKKQGIDGVVIISASGEKHAPIIARKAKKARLRVTLITSTKNSSTEKLLDKGLDQLYTFPKQKEPYTYNTSTYMGMILGKGGEKPQKIYDYITKKVSRIKLPDFKKYDKYYLILPPQFEKIKPMLHTKFAELFGRTIARDIETTEHTKHATTVVPSNELFISFGEKNNTWGKHRLHIPLPKDAGYATMMAIAYYIIGKIQAEKEPVFKKHIQKYTEEATKIFKQKIGVIVE